MADYLQTLLTTGETIQMEARQHWVALIRYAIQPLFILGAAIVLLLIGQWLQPSGTGLIDGLIGILDTIVGIVTLALFVAAVVWIPVQFVRWKSRRFVVTTRRVIVVQGVMRRSSNEAALEKLTDVQYKESFTGRQLGFGDLAVVTASGAPLDMPELIGALDFKKAIMAAQEALIRERAGQILGRPLTGPPPAPEPAVGSAAAVSAAPAVVAAPSPVSPAPLPTDAAPALAPDAGPPLAADEAAPLALAPEPTRDAGAQAGAEDALGSNPEDVTALLVNLADLRDKGAITDEEFEAKKQQLLAQL